MNYDEICKIKKLETLVRANLEGANLEGANLSMVKGLLNQLDYLSKFERDTQGRLIAYKTFGGLYNANPNWVLEKDSVIEEVINSNRTDECGCGIYVGSLEYVKKNYLGDIWKLSVEPWTEICVPYNTDGKFRVAKATLIEIV